jgi:hypothetical protein
MEFYQREYFLSKVKLGYNIVDYRGKRIKIYPPDAETEFLAQEVYIRSLEESDCMSEQEAVNLVIEEGNWNSKLEEELTVIIPKHIKYWKVKLYEDWFKINQRDTIRKYLAAPIQEEYRLQNIKHKYFLYTREYIAGYQRDLFILSRTARCDKKSINWHEINIAEVYPLFQQSVISPTTLKELARSTSWTNYYLSCRKNGIKPFGKILTMEQKLLLHYTTFYRNIYKNPDCPDQEIIEDDDALEGWIILKNREAEAERGKKKVASMVHGKLSKAGEIYLPASNVEEIEKIESLNNPVTQRIKQQRNRELKQRGTMGQDGFSDVRVDLLKQAEMQRQKRK